MYAFRQITSLEMFNIVRRRGSSTLSVIVNGGNASSHENKRLIAKNMCYFELIPLFK